MAGKGEDTNNETIKNKVIRYMQYILYDGVVSSCRVFTAITDTHIVLSQRAIT